MHNSRAADSAMLLIPAKNDLNRFWAHQNILICMYAWKTRHQRPAYTSCACAGMPNCLFCFFFGSCRPAWSWPVENRLRRRNMPWKVARNFGVQNRALSRLATHNRPFQLPVSLKKAASTSCNWILTCYCHMRLVINENQGW